MNQGESLVILKHFWISCEVPPSNTVAVIYWSAYKIPASSLGESLFIGISMWENVKRGKIKESFL